MHPVAQHSSPQLPLHCARAVQKLCSDESTAPYRLFERALIRVLAGVLGGGPLSVILIELELFIREW